MSTWLSVFLLSYYSTIKKIYKKKKLAGWINSNRHTDRFNIQTGFDNIFPKKIMDEKLLRDDVSFLRETKHRDSRPSQRYLEKKKEFIRKTSLQQIFQVSVSETTISWSVMSGSIAYLVKNKPTRWNKEDSDSTSETWKRTMTSPLEQHKLFNLPNNSNSLEEDVTIEWHLGGFLIGFLHQARTCIHFLPHYTHTHCFSFWSQAK